MRCLDDIIRQGTLGTHMYIYSGGKTYGSQGRYYPFMRSTPRLYVLAFTNGTLIDEKFADEMLRVKALFLPLALKVLRKLPTCAWQGHI